MGPSDFKAAFFPVFDTTNDSVVQAAITASTPYFDVSRWGDLLPDGQGNFVAHRIVINNPAAFPGQSAGVVGDVTVTDKMVGSVRVGRAAGLRAKQMDDPYMLTSYGREYRRLANLVGLGGAVT